MLDEKAFVASEPSLVLGALGIANRPNGNRR